MKTTPARPRPDARLPRAARETSAPLKKFIATLSRRTVELADSNLELSREILQRRKAEKALRKSERHHALLLAQSGLQQQKLRRLSRRILSVQEEERKKISRELHDVIAQTLAGITIRLASLRQQAALGTRGLDRHIARTQRLVEKSVNLVQQFARELRPAVLDDLGLIPALHSFMQAFTARTGVHTCLTAAAAVERLDTARRTALFRIAQEALTNVARHARASRVEITLRALPDAVSMTVRDDGVSFRLEDPLAARGRKRLGLLGMRERVEMVGGRFGIDASPGKGTTLTALIPLGKARKAAPSPRKPPSP